MKKIILGLSLVLIFVQNGFALTDEEEANFDIFIAFEQNKTIKQMLICERAASEKHRNEEKSLQECIKAVEMIQQSKDPEIKQFLGGKAYSTGLIYYFAKDELLLTYKYWSLAAENGHKEAQRNLYKLIKAYPWLSK